MRVDKAQPAVGTLEGGELKMTEFDFAFDEADDNTVVCDDGCSALPATSWPLSWVQAVTQ